MADVIILAFLFGIVVVSMTTIFIVACYTCRVISAFSPAAGCRQTVYCHVESSKPEVGLSSSPSTATYSRTIYVDHHSVSIKTEFYPQKDRTAFQPTSSSFSKQNDQQGAAFSNAVYELESERKSNRAEVVVLAASDPERSKDKNHDYENTRRKIYENLSFPLKDSNL
ncbi:hypothetical protein BSL78_11798 [Apostichopus japonicus]|uniref:Uncharacterized protein n=1 Tax=Stichopus japonicus TaxID=307972 RepID=A0A2G8KTJ6_STIJA|nr:hypothetical protein BSL78_11798 [Apostichopus japonicus]